MKENKTYQKKNKFKNIEPFRVCRKRGTGVPSKRQIRIYHKKGLHKDRLKKLLYLKKRIKYKRKSSATSLLISNHRRLTKLVGGATSKKKARRSKNKPKRVEKLRDKIKKFKKSRKQLYTRIRDEIKRIQKGERRPLLSNRAIKLGLKRLKQLRKRVRIIKRIIHLKYGGVCSKRSLKPKRNITSKRKVEKLTRRWHSFMPPTAVHPSKSKMLKPVRLMVFKYKRRMTQRFGHMLKQSIKHYQSNLQILMHHFEKRYSYQYQKAQQVTDYLSLNYFNLLLLSTNFRGNKIVPKSEKTVEIPHSTNKATLLKLIEKLAYWALKGRSFATVQVLNILYKFFLANHKHFGDSIVGGHGGKLNGFMKFSNLQYVYSITCKTKFTSLNSFENQIVDQIRSKQFVAIMKLFFRQTTRSLVNKANVTSKLINILQKKERLNAFWQRKNARRRWKYFKRLYSKKLKRYHSRLAVSSRWLFR